MKKAHYIYTALILCCLTGCIENEDVPCDSRVQLTLSVASGPGQQDTRLADGVTLTDGTSVRTVQNFWLIPYSVRATKEGDVWVPRKITATDRPLSAPISEVSNVASINRQYHYTGRPEESLEGAASFLCYAKADPAGDEKTNGAITVPELSSTSVSAGDISFAPTPIYNQNNTPHATANSIAAYLTGIATAGGWNTSTDTNWQTLFNMFTNDGNLMAGSCANVRALVSELKNVVSTKMPDGDLKTAILAAIGYNIDGSVGSGWPANIGLPDGAAVLQWTGSAFVPQTQATTMAQMVSQNRYAYPAEMYFYANSQIHTSDTEVPSTEYVGKTWDQVLALYANKYAVIEGSTKGAAIIDPLCYGVGSLRATVASETTTLKDADEKEITLSDTNFPLKGLLISGQYTQGFDFTPQADALNEYVIYDSQFSNVYLRNTDSPTAFSTLAFHSKDNDNVWIALEFENRSEETFRGVNGLVYPGTKFYLVGQLTLDPMATQDYEHRVFTQSYVTQATLKVSSLANAYNVIPDLLSARMDVGVQVVTDWIEATTTTTILK